VGFELDNMFDETRNSRLEMQAVFTNREREQHHFLAAIGRLQHARSSPPSDSARNNVLVYYGIGGIGKSSLSNELQRQFQDQSLVGFADRRFVSRANFEQSELLDFETLLLSIRGSLGTQRAGWPAFDIAFHIYWSLKYPGMSLQQFATSSGRLGAIMGKVNLGDQIRATLETLVFGGIPVLGASGKLAKGAIGAVRTFAKKRELFADFPAFERLVNLDSANEMLPFLPALLEYDLRCNDHLGQGQAVFFLDNFETVQAASSALGSPEDLIARMCYLMPTALFVITGRDKVNWAVRQPSVHYSGSAYWPGLASATGDQDQFAVRSLSPDHCLEYISQRLLCDGIPAIPEDVASAIALRSSGHPMHLQYSVQHFNSLVSRNISPKVADVNRDFPEIVVRLMRDLPPVQRSLARAAAILGTFDGALLRRTVSEARDADIVQFLNRHFVDHSSTAWLPSSLHAILRDSILEHDASTADAWSERERAAHADAALSAIAERVEAMLSQPDGTMGDPAAAALVVVTRLLNFTDEWPEWTMELAYLLRILWRSTALRFPTTDRTATGVASGKFGDLCLAMAQRCDGEHIDAVPLLRSLLNRKDLTNNQRAFIGNRLGKTLEETGHVAEARTLLEDAAERLSGRLSAVARKDRARFILQEGVDAAALSWAEDGLVAVSRSERRQAADLLGWVHFFAGQLPQAAKSFRTIYERRHDPESRLDIHTSGRALALTLAWSGDPAAAVVIAKARETNRGLASTIGLAQCEMAAAISEIVYGSESKAYRHLELAQTLMFQGQSANEYWLLHFTSLGIAAASGNWVAARTSVKNLKQELDSLGYHPHLSELSLFDQWDRLATSTTGTLSPKANNWLAVLANLRNQRLGVPTHD